MLRMDIASPFKANIDARVFLLTNLAIKVADSLKLQA